MGDATYTLSEHLLIPLIGADRLGPAQDAFHYFLSQLHIRVEMAFGRLVKKFGILSVKVGGSVEHVSAILAACARFRNYIIMEDGPFECEFSSVVEEYDLYEITPNPAAPLGMSYLPIVPDEEFLAYPGISPTREGMLIIFMSTTFLGPCVTLQGKGKSKRRKLLCLQMGIWWRENLSVRFSYMFY